MTAEQILPARRERFGGDWPAFASGVTLPRCSILRIAGRKDPGRWLTNNSPTLATGRINHRPFNLARFRKVYRSVRILEARPVLPGTISTRADGNVGSSRLIHSQTVRRGPIVSWQNICTRRSATSTATRLPRYAGFSAVLRRQDHQFRQAWVCGRVATSAEWCLICKFPERSGLTGP